MQHKGIIFIGIAIVLVGGYLLLSSIGGQIGKEDGNLNTPAAESAMTAEHKAVLVFPGEDASQAIKEWHSNLVARFAEKSEALDVTGCNVNPLVFEVQIGDTFTAKNEDPVNEYSVYVGEGGSFTVPPGGSIEVVADFGEGIPQDFGYSCYNTADPKFTFSASGILHLVQ